MTKLKFFLGYAESVRGSIIPINSIHQYLQPFNRDHQSEFRRLFKVAQSHNFFVDKWLHVKEHKLKKYISASTYDKTNKRNINNSNTFLNVHISRARFFV